MLTEAQQALIETLSNQNNPNGPQHAVTKILSSLWKEGIVPYIMDNSLSKYIFLNFTAEICKMFYNNGSYSYGTKCNYHYLHCMYVYVDIITGHFPVQTLTELMSSCVPQFCQNIVGKQNPLRCHSLIWTHIA